MSCADITIGGARPAIDYAPVMGAVCACAGVTLAIACAQPPAPPATAIKNVRGPLPPRTVTCYTGMFTEHDGARVRIVMRRTVDPEASTIRQEAVRSSGGFGFVLRGAVDLAINGSAFRSHTPENAHGDGRLDGPAWAWTHWTETRRHRDEQSPYTEEIEGWLTGDHLRFRGRYIEKSTTWSAELDLLDCALYDARIDAMTGLDGPLER